MSNHFNVQRKKERKSLPVKESYEEWFEFAKLS